MPEIPGCWKSGSDALLRAGQKVVAGGVEVMQAWQAETNKVAQAVQADLATLTKIKYGAQARAAVAFVTDDGPQGPDSGSFEDLVKKEPGNYIFLFNVRSPINIDWSNPSGLSWTSGLTGLVKKAKDAPSAIGHAQIGWAYVDEQGKMIIGGAGQAGQHGGEGGKVAWEGWGLNVLNTVYLDGNLETKQDVLYKTKRADEQQNFSWLAIKVDRATVMKMANFVNEYQQSGCFKQYGFPVDPLKFEGGGCTSFADAAFVKTGLDIPLFEASKRHLNLPAQYLGVRTEPVPNTRAPRLAASEKDEKKVPVTAFVFGTTRWATESEPHQDFAFYDPELYFESTVSMENFYRKREDMAPKAYMRTEQPDPAQVKAKAVSEAWVTGLLRNHVPVTMGQIHHTTGLIIDLSKTANCQAGQPAPKPTAGKPTARKAKH